MSAEIRPGHRVRLNRDRVLEGAVALADAVGIDGLSMRALADELGVVPMAIYKHVANKEELLDGMVDVVVGEIDAPVAGEPWKATVRCRVLAARGALLRHPWARRVIESRTNRSPAVLAYMDSFIGMFLAGGFTIDLTHHVMHALGSRMWGFTQEVFDDSASTPLPPAPAPAAPEAMAAMAALYPNIVAVAMSSVHDDASVVGQGCDDQFEFEFALDVMLDGFERLHRAGWTSSDARSAQRSPREEDRRPRPRED